MRILTLTLILLFSGIVAKADSTKTYTGSMVRYVLLKDLSADTSGLRTIDTSIDNKQNFNPVFKSGEPRIYLGNLGTPYQNLYFNENRYTGFSSGMRALDIYEYNPDNVKFYRTISPFSRLTYFWNGKKEQLFNLEFAQNITPRWNYALEFKRLVSLGDYQRQKTDHLNFYGTTWYSSLSRRYTVAFSYSLNNIRNEENGGISNDSLFSAPSSIQSEFEPVYLTDAQSRWRTSSIYLKQSLNLGKKESMIVDSVKINRVVSRHRLSYDINYSRKQYTYIENQIDSGYYPTIYLDSFKTYDAIKIEELKNEASYDLFGNRKKADSSGFYFRNFNLTGGIRSVNYNQNKIDTLINSVLWRSSLDLTLFRFLYVRADISTESFEDSKTNTAYGVRLRNYLKRHISYIDLEWRNTDVQPDFITQHYYSNHYRWENKFNNIQTNSYRLSYVNLHWDLRVSLKYAQVNNWVYFDTVMNPIQYKNTIDVYGVELVKNFDVWKFHLDNIITVQQSSENKIIRQPDLYTYNSFYFESPLFKRAMLLRIGFDSRYYTSYYGYNYNPATMQSFQDDQFKSGDYPVIDFFVSAKVKRAILILKVDYANQGMTTGGAYQVRNYPLPDRAFKIGVSWAFYD